MAGEPPTDSDPVGHPSSPHLGELREQYRKSRSLTYWTLTAALVCALAIAVAPVPFLLLSPGPMYNTIGSVDGVEMINISGTRTYPTSGELNMTTVTERGGPYGGLTLPEAYYGWFNSEDVVAPVDLFYAPEVTKQEAEEEGARDFTSAQSSAIAASLGYLKIPVTSQVVVTTVLPNAPADGHLQVGDLVTSLNGVKVTKPEQLPNMIRPMKPGSTAIFGIVRATKAVTVDVTVAASPKNPQSGYVGITTGVEFSGPFPITFGVEGVGGPSAGLMFALGIVDKLTPDNLANSRMVAGTGTIDPLGGVGSIGGIAQKMYAARDAGVELFIAPDANCSQVKSAGVSGLNVVAVKSLSEAVSVLEKWKAGATDLPRC